MLAIFVGILSEQMAVEGGMEVLERLDMGGYPVSLASCRQKPLVVCRTGLGEERGGRAAETILSEYHPTAVVSARMTSSVPDDVRVGDLVLCEKVHLCRGYELAAQSPSEADRRLLVLAEQAAREAQLKYTLSSVLTAATLRAGPLDRERLPRGYSVVDTEGHSLAEAARAHGIPFLAIRFALGRSFDQVPEGLNLVAERGIIRPWWTIGRCLRRPRDIPAIVRLAASMRRACRKLSLFMREFLREWSLEP